ncbi:DNA polymerase subunit gamma-2, mitochondrial-like [Argiope bruennichi]|uniref:DNA polymerase subunit gamma-2, mitochondrial-like n=1 Tax=Argiope bruennichi TaxID=94029 RepID=UPI002495490A|nr:DNA polymerase subunit gamma-2, mitochondrial-like [Argiope bruennichi]XP_055938372.1 DNA polymerase subunit gamma-2, mitochondrial-like [Argiope bruennichi]XP_055938373.1 DNA polymerase subunit gamma-2, mitochondrial-like [Argiope bruennichi]XP_055938374.1 DNA polymerase subunit gamma-2, mitochondrial-like [Argiope bruennichi]
MPSQTAANSFKNLIHLCNRNHILNIKRTANNTTLQYGPLGCYLKMNILNEWFGSLLNNADINLFPIELTNLRKQSFLFQRIADTTTTTTSLLQDVIGNYFDIHTRFGCNLPFGLAVYGPCINKNTCNKKTSSNIELNMLSDLETWTRLSVVFFCPAKKSLNWFHHWSKQRYMWWRKYSSIPSKFSMSEVTKSQFNDQQLSLLHEHPWGKDQLETITLHDNKIFEELWEKYHINNEVGSLSQDIRPSVVTCETELDLAVITYLSNSFAVKRRDGEDKNVFHLHYKLAPYKVSLAVEETDADNFKKLKNVINHLTKELKQNGIDVLPESDFKLNQTIKTTFERCDEMGIPYIIVLNENSLQTGIAGLRSRDTILQEQVHITELAAKLVKYLKIKR